MKIPFVDLGAQYRSIKDEIDSAISSVLSETAFIKGPYVEKFESEFANYLGVKQCIGCANGTDAIEVVLAALEIGPGDEVIVPARSWISTSEAVTTVGATPVFVDCLPGVHTIDPNKIEEKITNKTRAIIPVHFHGLPAEMEEILAIAKRHNLLVIEDTAQGHGATYRGKKVGTFGIAATFSFFPGKNLGAYGDAGGIVTDDKELAKRCRMICDHGQLSKHLHEIEGRNSRLDGLQAAILSVKLKYLENWTEARRANAKHYTRLLAKANLTLPVEPNYSRHVYHLFVIECENRDRVIKALGDKDISAAIHYPVALPFLKAYERFGHSPNDFPVAHSQMQKIVSLPMYPELNGEQIAFICSALAEALQ